MKITAVTLIISLLSAILTPLIAADHQPKSLDDWLGHSADELRGMWGMPDKVYTSPDGALILVYEKGRKVSLGLDDPDDSLSRSPQVTGLKKTLEFRTDAAGVIVGYNRDDLQGFKQFATGTVIVAVTGAFAIGLLWIIFHINPGGQACPTGDLIA